MEEISLRDLINIVLKGKKTIAVVTFVSLFLSIVYSFFIAQPVYETTISFLVSPVGLAGGSNVSSEISIPTNLSTDNTDVISQIAEDIAIINNVNNIVAAFAYNPKMNRNIYMQEVKSPVMLNNVAKSLGLEMTGKKLKDKLVIDNKIEEKETDFVKIKSRYKDPDTAVKIAYEIYRQFNDYITKIVQENTNRVESFVVSRRDKEKENYDKLLNEIGILTASSSAEQRQINDLKHKAEVARKTYEAFDKKLRDIQMQREANMNKPCVQITLEPVWPEEPAEPKKMLILAIGTVLGLMAGTMLVFFQDYWKKSEPEASK